MRTTVTSAPDVAAAVSGLQRDEGIGVSAAVNALVRRALAQRSAPEGHADVFGRLLVEHQCTGDPVPDADLAALAIEHGSLLASADTDFARSTPELTWLDPLSG